MFRNSSSSSKTTKVDLVKRGYCLTTAEILYRMPDSPSMLQAYIWQELDLAPKFPVLQKFLTFWKDNLDGPLHSVRVASTGLISPVELKYADFDFMLQ